MSSLNYRHKKVFGYPCPPHTWRPTGPGGPGNPLDPSSPFWPKRPCWPLGPGSPSAPWKDDNQKTQALQTQIQNLLNIHAVYIKNLQQDRVLQQVLEAQWDQGDPEKKETRYLVQVLNLQHKIWMQSITYMLSFITFASLLPWLSDFSLQKGSDQTALIIAEVKGRLKCDDEHLKTKTSEPNYIQPDNQWKPLRDLSEAAWVIWQGSFHNSLLLQYSLNS